MTADGYIQGWASTADVDLVRHIVAPAAFDRSIRERGLRGPSSVKLQLDHRSERPAGLITKLETRNRGLWIEAQLNLDVGYVRDRWSMIQMVGGHSFSVGFFPKDFDIAEDKNGNEYLRILSGDLFEVSVVLHPANPGAVMRFARSEAEEIEELSRAFRGLKEAASALSREMRRSLTAGAR